MGICWGIVEYSAKYDREEVIGDWEPFALAVFALNPRRTLSVMHGEDRIVFRGSRNGDGQIELVTTATRDHVARARIDKLRCDDGTYDQFDLLFDGYEVFVPWRTIPVAIDTATRSWQAWPLAHLEGSLWGRMDEFAEDPDLDKLARQLIRAAATAGPRNMLVTVSY
ncbi:hypothetical protein ABZU75_28370 [Streptosporangium sp. NPDC005286]|uniref:hypothetical protein n=1 Tax=Streptosporangium sp. NPDC005286 TaxID=3154463 RepID=UPI0033BCC565